MNRASMTGGRGTTPLADRGPWGRVWKGVAVLGVLAVWAYVLLAGDSGWLNLRRERQQLEGLQSEVARLQAQNDSLRLVLERMANDPDFLEKVAREKLGMIRSGEHLYRIRGSAPQGE